MKNRFKKVLRIFTVFTFTIILALSAFLIYLNSSPGQKFIKNVIISHIENNLNLKAEIGSLETDLISYFYISEINIYPDKQTPVSPLLSLNRLELNYSLYNLIFRERKIDYLLIDSLSIFISRDSIGEINLPFITEVANTGNDSIFVLPVKLGLAEIKDVNIFYNDNYTPVKSSCLNLNIRIEKTEKENTYTLNTSSDLISLEYFKEPIELNQFSFNGYLQDDWTIRPGTLKASLSDLVVSGSLSSDINTISGNFTIAGNPQNLITALAGINSSDFSEFIRTRIICEIKDYRSSPEIDLNLSMPRYYAENIAVEDFILDGQFKSDTLNLSEASFRISGGTVSTSGWVAFDSLLSHKLIMNINDLDIKNPKINPASQYINRLLYVDFNLNSKGYISDLSSLKLNSVLRIFTDNSDILKTSIGLENSHFTILSDSCPVVIQGELQFTDTEYSGGLNINVKSLDSLSSLFNVEGVSGIINLFSSIKGKWSDIHFNTSIRSSGIYLKNTKVVDTIAVSLRNRQDQILIDSIFITGTIENIDSVTSWIMPAGLKGNMVYSLLGTGTTADPELNFHAHLTSPGIGQFGFNNIELRALLKNNTISLTDFQIKKDSILLTSNGIFDLSNMNGELHTKINNENLTKTDTILSTFTYNSPRNYRARISSDKLHLETFSNFLPDLGINSGELKMDLDILNSEDQIHLTLPFKVLNLQRKDLILNSATGSINIDTNYIAIDSVDMMVGNNASNFSVKIELQKDNAGNYFLNEDSRTEGYLYANQIELEMLNPFLEDFANIKGTSNLNLQWNGIISNPHFNGRLNINNGYVILPDTMVLVSDLKGSIDFKDSIISISNLTAEFDKKPLSIEGEIKKNEMTKLSALMRITSNDTVLLDTYGEVSRDSLNMNLQVNDAHLGMAGVLFPFMRDVNGVVTSKLLIAGSMNNPGIIGIVSLKDIAYNPQFMNLDIRNGMMSAHINNGKAVLDTGFFNIGKGSLSVKGNMLYDNNEIKDINMNATGSDLLLSEPDNFSLKINDFDLNLSRQDQKYKLAGFIQFGTSRYIHDLELANLWELFIAKTEGVIENKSQEEPLDLTRYIEEYQLSLINYSDYLKDLDVDIAIKNSDSIWVENNVAKIRFHPDLTLRGDVETPLVNGRIKVEEDGNIKFLDRDFSVKEGIVEFGNPERINPHLNISAESEVTSSSGFEGEDYSYRIILKMQGPLDDFDFTMTSDPPLDNVDIISLLTLGMTYQQLQASQDVNSALKERAGVLTTLELSNKLNNYYQELLGDVIQIDRIGIGGNLFNPGETRFEIAKSWADRVEISYSTAVDNLERQILKAKLKLIKYFYLEGRTDQEYESGIDLKFHFKFK